MMTSLRHLLLIVTAHQSCNAALTRAAALALNTRARLSIHVYDEKPGKRMGALDPELAEQLDQAQRRGRRRWLDQTLADLQRKGIEADGRVILSQPLQEAMLADIVESEADLVIREVRRESALSRLFFTPEDWYLARLSPVDLLLIGEGHDQQPLGVIAAVDLNHMDALTGSNRHIAHRAQRLASASDAPLHLSHASREASTAAPHADERNTEESALRALATELAIPADRCHVASGRPDRIIPDLAGNLGAEILVIGANRGAGSDPFVLGHTATDLINNAGMDVLIVKPESFGSWLLNRDMPTERPQVYH